MKIKVLFFLLFISTLLMSFELPKNINKKVTKEIKSVYKVATFSLEVITVSDELNKHLKTRIGANNLFKILNDSTHIGYAYIGKAASKVDDFDYMVLFDTDLIVKKAKVLIYREDYGAEVASKRWLKQFIGLNENSDILYGDDIVAISGATISAYSLTVSINNLLKTVAILKQNEVI